jgi:hypothetical protein
MATMRQSIISLGYVLILIPRIKDGAEVLDQRDISQNMEKADLQEIIDKGHKKLNHKKEEGEAALTEEEKEKINK